MQTNRLRFQTIDQSFSVGTPTALKGACVIKAPKGSTVPQLVYKNDYQTFLNLFGTPSSSYPGIGEAMDYLGNYSLWVSAPSTPTGSTFGGVYLTKFGTVEKFYNVTEGSDGKPNLGDTVYTIVDEGTTGRPLSPTGSKSFSTDLTLATASTKAPLYGVILTTNGVSIKLTVDTDDDTFTHTSDSGVITKECGTASLATQTVITDKLAGLTPPFTVDSTTTVQYIYDISDYTIMALYQTSPRTSTGTFSSFVVDTTEDVYPSYNYKFTIDSTSSGSSVLVNVCDTVVSISTTSTASTTAEALRAALVGKSLGLGYKLDTTYSTGVYIVINALYGKTPTISSAYPAKISAKLSKTFTLSNAPTVTDYSVIIGGIPKVVTPATADIQALATAIGTAYASTTPYSVVASTNDIIVSYDSIYSEPVVVISGANNPVATAGTSPISPISSAVPNSTYNTLKFNYSEKSYEGSDYNPNTFMVSPSTSQVDSMGNIIFAETVLEGNLFIGAKVYNSSLATASGYSWNSSSNTVVGTRTVTDDSLEFGWNSMADEKLQDVNVFFDPECVAAVADNMATLRTSTFPFATFVTGINVANAEAKDATSVDAVVQNIITARATYPNVTGLAYYCNEFMVKEPYTSTSYWTTPIGAVSAMLTLIQETKLGGAAPMFTNEGNPSIGGQITKSVLRQKYQFNADHLDMFDNIGVNPVILDNFYGLMMTSQKTAQSALTLTDWSFLGHQMSFDMFMKEVKQSVMLAQIGKLIDARHMAMRREQTQIILDKRLKDIPIWSAGVVEVESVNTPETKAANTFVIKVKVKVTPFSEYVSLVFTSVGQTTSVTPS